MNIPRFTNPHCSHEQQTVTTSRATIFPQNHHFVVDGDKLAELDELLETDLGSFQVSHTRKRKKHTSSVGEESSLNEVGKPAPFRLLSVGNPPKVISLEPKPLPARTIWEPPCEDNDCEAEIRRRHALSAAVDITSIFKSAQTYITRPEKPGKVIHATAEAPLSSLAVFLAEMRRRNPSLSRELHNRAIRPSPHEIVMNGDGLPVVSLKLQGSEQPAARSKRKRRRKTVERPPATFWRPLRGWGGKAPGYAMGYEGSWAVGDEDEQRQKCYVRDKMRKAVYVMHPS